MSEFANEIGTYHKHLCMKCWHSTKVEDTDQATAPCWNCDGVAVRLVVTPIVTDPQGLLKCGGKDKLSKWEEIKHRPPVGAKGF